jgi:small-conductance mechanosensitive channel
MDALASWLQDTFGMSATTQSRVLGSVVAVLLLWMVRRVVLWLAWRRVKEARARYRWRKITTYVVVPIGFLVVGRIWFAGFGSLATFLGLVSAGVAIALKDLLVNLAGWGFILWRRPFEVGDRIQIGEHAGDVIDIRIFQFSLLEVGNWVNADQSTGRVLHIPNGQVLGTPLANFSKGFQYIWNELPVTVTFESDWREAKEILAEIANEHAEHLSAAAEERIRDVSRRFLIFYSNLTPIVYTSVADHGVTLTVRSLCEPRTRRGTTENIWEAILDAFARADNIDFAYPTQRFYDNRIEGKPRAGAPLGAEPTETR